MIEDSHTDPSATTGPSDRASLAEGQFERSSYAARRI
jgi:hypothetical protein